MVLFILIIDFLHLVKIACTIMTTPSIYSSLSTELIELARINCNENSEKVDANIAVLIDWIKKSRHLKARTDHRLLLSFLRRSQFSLEDTKRRIDAYYSMKNSFPEVLCKRDVSDSLLELMQTGVHIIPEHPIRANGSRLIISQYSKVDANKFHPRQAFKLLFMLLEILAQEDNNVTICGVTHILDARDVTMEQMLQYTPYLLKKIWMLVERALPIKFNSVHIINMRREGQSIFNFVTTFLPVKMPFPFNVYHKAEDLYENLPRDAMTSEYGGHNGYTGEAVKIWIQKLKDYKNYFANDGNYGTNEKLRVGSKKRWDISEELGGGLSGSFRKIDVD